MPTLRVFIAIELSPAARTALAQLQQRLKGVVPPQSVRWTAPENIHLTLHFLGDIPADEVSQTSSLSGPKFTSSGGVGAAATQAGETAPLQKLDLLSLLRAAAATCPPFALTLGGLGCFPNTRRPRIVWTGVAGQMEALLNLHRDLGQRLKTSGFTPEMRPYSPHLTLGRVKDGLPQRLLSQLGQVLEQTQPQIGQLAALDVAEISLMQSDLKPAGPVYTQLAAAVLYSMSSQGF